jgi:hypothetical protein
MNHTHIPIPFIVQSYRPYKTFITFKPGPTVTQENSSLSKFFEIPLRAFVERPRAFAPTPLILEVFVPTPLYIFKGVGTNALIFP